MSSVAALLIAALAFEFEKRSIKSKTFEVASIFFRYYYNNFWASVNDIPR